MALEGTILWGVMIALLLLGIVIGSTMQKAIDDAKLHAEQTRANEYRDTLERERQEAASAQREERRRHEEERKVFLVALEDLQQALRGERLRVDIYRKGGRL